MFCTSTITASGDYAAKRPDYKKMTASGARDKLASPAYTADAAVLGGWLQVGTQLRISGHVWLLAGETSWPETDSGPAS